MICGPVVWHVENVSVAVFMDTIEVVIVKFCMMGSTHWLLPAQFLLSN